MKRMGTIAALVMAVAICGVVWAEDGYNPDLLPNRLSFAKVGEWVSYALPDGYVQKLSVIRRAGDSDEGTVTVRVENLWKGEVVDSREITEVAGESFTAPRVPNEPGVTVALRQEAATLRGSPVAVSVVEINTYSDDPDEVKAVEYWITSDIPVFGILKKVEDGEVEWELADYGGE